MLAVGAILLAAAYGDASTKNTTPGPQTNNPAMAANEVSINKRNGFSAAKTYNMMDRQHRQGSHIMEGQGIVVPDSSQLDNPDYDPVHHMALRSAKDSEVDREDTEWALRTQQSKIVPRKNNAVAASLSETIVHPDDGSAASTFFFHKVMPNYANEQLRQQALEEMARYGESQRERQLRSETRPLFSGPVPGLSFRYSDF